jgi:hypothetical protein
MNRPGFGNAADAPRLESGKIKFPALSRLLPITLVILLQLLVGALIFRDFLFGDKLLLYKDIVGSDSVNDTYPTLVHLSDYIRYQGFPSWSFSSGMGQSLFYLTGSLIWEPILWLPRQFIASGLVFQHLVKALIAGLLFLPIAVALSGLVTVFHLYLSAVLLCFYVPARLVEIYGWKPGVVFRVCTRLALFAFLGVGLGAIVSLGSGYTVLNTPRASGSIGNFAFGAAPHPFEFGSWFYYTTAVLRQFSSDMIGTGDGYRGWQNYYEGSLGYCGLLSLLLVPQAFAGATRRQRILYAMFLALIIIPVVFPWFRYLLWLFQGGTSGRFPCSRSLCFWCWA